jgi:beta-galactosidase
MFPHVIFGGDYYPEQWSPDIWQEDVRLMQEAGVNLVTLGVFAWAKMEPHPGHFDFDWLDQLMDLLYAHGVRVNLATPTASPPAWLVRLHPEILPVTEDGVTLWHGSRRHYCPHSQAYRERAMELVTHLAQHVHSHPALALWHVDNEYACHVTECFCDTSVAAFRQWLHDKYGTLDELNKSWGTAFWGQSFGDWEEIMAPRRTPARINSSHQLDWQRFCSDAWLGCFEDQKRILGEITPDIPITTNFMGLHKPLDYWKWAAHEDIVSYDSYPDLADPEWMINAGMMYDMMRSLSKGRPWLLMEQAPSQVNWRQRNVTKRPGEMRLGSYQALARGANGMMFFQWRASITGSEKFHSAIVSHAGTDTRVWREIKTLGKELPQLDELLESHIQAEVAILFDWENWWALEQADKPCNDLQLLYQIKQIYTELFHRKTMVDFVHPTDDLSPYRLVIVPHLYLIGDGTQENLENYVKDGGKLLMTFFSGIVDQNERVLTGGYPAPFREMLGLWVEEFVAYADNQNNRVQTSDGREFSCDFWSDVIHPTGAEILAVYQNDYFAKEPALTVHRFGKGACYYLGTRLAPEGLAWLLDRVCSEADVHPVLEVPGGVEVTLRNDGVHQWLFVLNYTENEVQIDSPSGAINILTGEPVNAAYKIMPKDVAIFQF